MQFDVKTLATINMLVQALLLVAVLVAAYLVRKRQLVGHCNTVRVAVVVQLLTIFFLMLPPMSAYLKFPRGVAFQTEMLAHHGLGVLIVLIWAYINLAVLGRVRVVGGLATYMRAALIMWVIAFLLGLHLYVQLYL